MRSIRLSFSTLCAVAFVAGLAASQIATAALVTAIVGMDVLTADQKVTINKTGADAVTHIEAAIEARREAGKATVEAEADVQN